MYVVQVPDSQERKKHNNHNFRLIWWTCHPNWGVMAIFGTLPTMWTTSPSTMWFGQWKRKMLLNWQEATSKSSPLRTIVRYNLCTLISVILCPVLAALWDSCMRWEKSKVLWNGTDSVLNFTHTIFINHRQTYFCTLYSTGVCVNNWCFHFHLLYQEATFFAACL